MGILHNIFCAIVRFESKFYRPKKEEPKEDTRKLYIRNEDLEALLNSKTNESGVLVLYQPEDKPEACSLGKIVFNNNYKKPGYCLDEDKAKMINLIMNEDVAIAPYKNVNNKNEEDENFVSAGILKRRMRGHYNLDLFISVLNKKAELFSIEIFDCGYRKREAGYQIANNNKIFSYDNERINEIIKGFNL